MNNYIRKYDTVIEWPSWKDEKGRVNSTYEVE
jgi:hypothetical protein